MLAFKRILHRDDPELRQIKPVYESAFPSQERRIWEDLLQILSEPKMNVNAIKNNEQFVGLVIFWQLEKWLYLEHLAIVPQSREKQFGRMAVEYLKAQEPGTLVLETELPEQEEAKRRIHFYEKSDLKLLPFAYKQPPYRKEEVTFPMALMAAKVLKQKECEQVTNLIKQEVYEKFY